MELQFFFSALSLMVVYIYTFPENILDYIKVIEGQFSKEKFQKGIIP